MQSSTGDKSSCWWECHFGRILCLFVMVGLCTELFWSLLQSFHQTRNLLKLRTMESFTLTRNQIKKFQRIVSGTLDASYQVCVSTRNSPKCLYWQKTRTRAALEVVDSHFQCNYQLMTLWSGSTWRIPWGRGLVVLCLLWPACESPDCKTWISFRCPTCEHATALRLKVGLDDQTNRPLECQ